jgi:hypothetical protein
MANSSYGPNTSFGPIRANGPQSITTEQGSIDIRSQLDFKDACQRAEEACALFQMESASANFPLYKDKYKLAEHVTNATEKSEE